MFLFYARPKLVAMGFRPYFGTNIFSFNVSGEKLSLKLKKSLFMLKMTPKVRKYFQFLLNLYKIFILDTRITMLF